MTSVLLAGLFHETHCFVDDITGIEDFRIARGQEVMDFRGNGSTIDGFLEVATCRGWEVIPVCAYAAMPSGIVDDEVVESFWRELESRALRGGFDAVFLSLHGAMISRGLQDVEGTLLARLRALPGMARIPVFGEFDLHANLTPGMTASADCLICYRKNPHTDARETAVRAANLLARAFSCGKRPHMVSRHAGIIWPPTGTGTDDDPMRALESMARHLEAKHPTFWAVNVVGGFSFADCEDTGVAFSIVADAGCAQIDNALTELCERAWDLRYDGLPSELDPLDALRRIEARETHGPVLLVEPSDNIGGGAPGDGTGILRAILESETRNAALILNDPVAVRALADVSPGDRSVLSLGGKGSRLDAGPVVMEVELLSKSDGRFRLEDMNSHLVASTGCDIEMGPCAVVRHRGVTLLLTSRKTPPFDLGQWHSQGLDPRGFSVIGVKAAVAHRRAYDPIAAASFTVSTPGPCTSDPAKLPYQRVRRPAFPLEN